MLRIFKGMGHMVFLPYIVFLAFLASCHGQKEPAITKQVGINSLDSVILAIMAEEKIPGAAFVLVRENNIVFKKGYGVKDLHTNEAVDPDTSIFRIGSVSKLFTAMAILKLVDRGFLDLETPVSSYISPQVFEDDPDHPVLVKHLLNHSSGFDQTGYSRRKRNPEARRSLHDFLKDELVPLRKPGLAGSYDTYGITLAGYLIEQVTGQSYRDFMKEEIFGALGMGHTFVETPSDLRSMLATGYGMQDGKLRAQPYEWYETLPASSIDATASDMAEFMRALLNDGSNDYGRLFSPQMARRVVSPMAGYGDRVHSFAYGFWEGSAHGRRSIDHGGVMNGFECSLYLVPGLRTGFFLVFNRDPETGPPTTLRNAVTEMVIHLLQPEDLRKPLNAPKVSINTELLEGIYVTNLGCFSCPPNMGWPVQTYEVKALAPGVIDLFGGPWVAVDSTVFQYREGQTRLAFIKDPDTGQKTFIYRNNSFTRLEPGLLPLYFGPDWQSKPPTALEMLMQKLQILPGR